MTVWDYEKSATRQINLDTLAEITPAPKRDERPPVARAAEPAGPRPVAVLESLPMEELTMEELDVLSENWFGRGSRPPRSAGRAAPPLRALHSIQPKHPTRMSNATPNADSAAAQTPANPRPTPAVRVLDADAYEALGKAVNVSFELELLASLLAPAAHLNEMYRLNNYAREAGKTPTFEELDRIAEVDPVVSAAESLSMHVILCAAHSTAWATEPVVTARPTDALPSIRPVGLFLLDWCLMELPVPLPVPHPKS